MSKSILHENAPETNKELAKKAKKMNKAPNCIFVAQVTNIATKQKYNLQFPSMERLQRSQKTNTHLNFDKIIEL
jgi:hypothetical protein